MFFRSIRSLPPANDTAIELSVRCDRSCIYFAAIPAKSDRGSACRTTEYDKARRDTYKSNRFLMYGYSKRY